MNECNNLLQINNNYREFYTIKRINNIIYVLQQTQI